jgi:hypothetical protein
MRIWRPGQLPESVKLQRPARATGCSHSLTDSTASVDPILINTRAVQWLKLQAMDVKDSSGDQVLKIAFGQRLDRGASPKVRRRNTIKVPLRRAEFSAESPVGLPQCSELLPSVTIDRNLAVGGNPS